MSQGIEKLSCNCVEPKKYQGESGILYCECCGGIANKEQHPDEIATNRAMYGAAFLSCKSCKSITWFDDPEYVEQPIKEYIRVLCPKCGKSHSSKGIDIT